ncbi:MAG TPA: class I SAM-dependent methyltransferase, partial [Bacteroidales bacterium]|nr:class I SAM-dependent methyltransferase [Bacteroidales bacterium]
EAKPFQAARGRRYYQCSFCHSILLDPDEHLSLQEEKERYEKHNNDVDDPRYQQFVSPVVESVLRHHTRRERGLDYGAGTGPVITKLLRDRYYTIETYDPFFDDNPEVLQSSYDYIVCCEVAEHFHRPYEEFQRLHQLMKPGGSLYCMTQLYREGIDFQAWNYKNDETHVIFYHPGAIKWIARQNGFAKTTIMDNKLFILKR